MVDRTLKSPSPPSAEPGAVLLETARLVLRRPSPALAPALAAAADDPAVASGLRDRFPSPYTLADAEVFLARHGGPVENRYPFHAALWTKPGTEASPGAEPRFVGMVGVMVRGDVNYRTWELGYWLAQVAWGGGLMTEAVGAFVPWCFATWPALNRVEAECYARNAASASVLRKCGFVKEGTRRGSAEKGGEILDEDMYSIIRSDLERL